MRPCTRALAASVAVVASAAAQQNVVKDYNLVWRQQSQNSAQSMPLGGGDIGLNVWVENDEVLFYVARSGTYDARHQHMKLGRVRMRLDPNPFADAASFRQELDIANGWVMITNKSQNKKQGFEMHVWVEIYRPVVHVEIESSKPVSIEASLETWNLPVKQLAEAGESPDVLDFAGQWALSYHRNVGKANDPRGCAVSGLTFGCALFATGMKPAGRTAGKYAGTAFKGLRIASAEPARQHSIHLVAHTARVNTASQWRGAIAPILRECEDGIDDARGDHEDYWAQFWKRSYLYVNPGWGQRDAGWQVGRNYQLFRFMLAANALGKAPIPANGGLFTVDPAFVRHGDARGKNPDARAGGSVMVATDQALLAWPLLETGDFAMIQPQLNWYRAAESTMREHVRAQKKAGLAFADRSKFCGLPETVRCSSEPAAAPGAAAVTGTIPSLSGEVEFAWLMLEHHRWTGQDLTPSLHFIEGVLRYFQSAYDRPGGLHITPQRFPHSTTVATNPLDITLGLDAILRRILELPSVTIPEDLRSYALTLLPRLPRIPIRGAKGVRVFPPAESFTGERPIVRPDLAGLFPYDQHRLGALHHDVARQTWEQGSTEAQRDHAGWRLGNVYTARLGLADEAKQYAILKLADSGRRTPAFWGPAGGGFPDHAWGAAGMIGLQDMVLQVRGKKLYLLPAWPKDWHVTFKLHAPRNTTIECEVKHAKIQRLLVAPPERRNDLVIPRDFLK